jgi:hypothetical protein
MNSHGSHQFVITISADLLRQALEISDRDNISLPRFVETAIEEKLRRVDHVTSIPSSSRAGDTDRSTIDQFIFDASELTARLDAITTCDNRHDHASVAEEGRQIFRQLQQRYESMRLNGTDSDSLEIFLNGLRERLKFLEMTGRKLQRRPAS